MTLVSFIFLFFFFYCYGDHRDLHSFPTRRSSDLICTAAIETTGMAALRSACLKMMRARDRPLARAVRIRSEEHTSELQSRGHLVCRLLLEKKKKNRRNTLTGTSNNHADNSRTAVA